MSERDDLLRGIREHPDDDAPRLVFADWLDDTFGASTRKGAKAARDWAARIRRAVELARTPRTEPRFWELQPTLAGRPPQAAVDLVPVDFRRSTEHQRGFPDGLQMSSRYYLRHADTIADCPAPFVRLRLHAVGDNLRDILARPELRQFREFGFTNIDRETNADIRLLADCPHLGNLDSLSVNHNGDRAAIAALLGSPTLAGLRRLVLEGDFQGDALNGLRAESSARPLRQLHLGGWADPGGFAALLAAPSLAGLRELSLWDNNHSQDASIVRAVADGCLPHLTTFSRRAEDLAAEPTFFRSACFRRLTRLDVYGEADAGLWSAVPDDPGPPGLSLTCRSPDEEASQALARSAILARCTELHVHLYHPSERFLSTLGRSPHTRHLRVLTVEAHPSTLDGPTLADFGRSPHLAGLLALHLLRSGMRASGLTALTEASFAGSLRALTFGQCIGLSDSDVSRLASPSVFPRLRTLQMYGDGSASLDRLYRRLAEARTELPGGPP